MYVLCRVIVLRALRQGESAVQTDRREIPEHGEPAREHGCRVLNFHSMVEYEPDI